MAGYTWADRLYDPREDDVYGPDASPWLVRPSVREGESRWVSAWRYVGLRRLVEWATDMSRDLFERATLMGGDERRAYLAAAGMYARANAVQS